MLIYDRKKNDMYECLPVNLLSTFLKIKYMYSDFLCDTTLQTIQGILFKTLSGLQTKIILSLL